MSPLSYIIVESDANLFPREFRFNWAIINLLEFIFRISLSTLEGLNDLLSIRLPYLLERAPMLKRAPPSS